MRIVLLALVAVAAQSSSGVDRAKLERLRKMTPEERRRLLERLDRYKKMSEEERERLRQNLGKFREMPPEVQKNLKEKAKALSNEERKAYQDLADGFFRSIQKSDRKALQAFPRVVFFVWLKNQHPGEVERLQKLGPDERIREFGRLSEEFRREFARRFAQHCRKHQCCTHAELEELRDRTGGDFWLRWRELTRQCAAKQKSIQKTR